MLIYSFLYADTKGLAEGILLVASRKKSLNARYKKAKLTLGFLAKYGGSGRTRIADPRHVKAVL